MTRFDLSPLFRSTIGFDHLDRLLDSALQSTEAGGYPPYNIEKTGDDSYRLTMAVAGFGAEDISIVAQANTLVVSGKLKDGDQNRRYLHRGIAGRAFQRSFELADFINVVGAKLENGILDVELAREVPEAMKPRTIQINGGSPKTIETKAAA